MRGDTSKAISGEKPAQQTHEITDYERQKDAIEKQISALEIEAQTLGMTAEAAARYKAEQQLINAALRDGTEITPELREAISSTADAFAVATKRLDEMRNRVEAVKQAAEGLSSSFSAAFEDMLFEGKSLNDVMASLAKTIGKDLVHSLLTGQGAFAGLLGTTGQNGQAGGLLGSIFGALLGGGKAEGGYIRGPGTGTSDSIPARLSNGEYVFSARAVSAIGVGNLDSLHRAARGFAGGGYVGSGGLGIRSSGAGDVNITVVNATGQPVSGRETSRQRNTSGGMDVTIMLEQIDSGLAQRISDGRGATARVLAAQFGVAKKFS